MALPIYMRSKPSSCLGVDYSDQMYIKERLHLKLELKVEINAHGKKKLEPNQDDATDHFFLAKRLDTWPPSFSTRARLVAPCNYNTSYLR